MARKVEGTITKMYANCPKSDGWFGCFFQPLKGSSIRVSGHTLLPLCAWMELSMTIESDGKGGYVASKLDIRRTPDSIRKYLLALKPGMAAIIRQIESLAAVNNMNALDLIMHHEDDLLSQIIPTEQVRREFAGDVVSQLAENEIKVTYPKLRMGAIRSLIETYGGNVMRILQKHPYQPFLFGTSVPGYTWKQAEYVASVSGVDLTDLSRIKAAVVEAFNRYFNDYKQVCVNISQGETQDAILDEVVKLVDGAVPVSMPLLENMFQASDSPFVTVEFGGDVYVYTKATYGVESSCVRNITHLLSSQDFVTPFLSSKTQIMDMIFDFETMSGRKLDACQVEAVVTSLTNRMSVLCGGPGCGKTTTISCIVYCWYRLVGGSLSVSGPTWRAVHQVRNAIQNCGVRYYQDHPNTATVAGRIVRNRRGIQSEAYGEYWYPKTNPLYDLAAECSDEDDMWDDDDMQASLTLYASGTVKNTVGSGFDRRRFQLAIIDETSMLGIADASVLLDLYQNSQIIWVGDVNQLSSIAPGDFFGDLCRCGSVPMGECRVNHRSESKEIVQNFRRVLNGFSSQSLLYRQGVFQAVAFEPVNNRTSAVCADFIANRYVQYLTAGWSKFDVAVLAPTRTDKYFGSTDDLNVRIQSILCPPVSQKQARFVSQYGSLVCSDVGMEIPMPADVKSEGLTHPYRVGDKIIAVRNRTGRTGVHTWINGDVGYIKAYHLPSIPVPSNSTSIPPAMMQTVLNDSYLEVSMYRGRDARGQELFEQVLVPFRYFGDFQLGYAMTVHKAQGAGYPVVLYSSQYEPSVWPEEMDFLTRNMLYTAISRAEKTVELIGSMAALDVGISRRGRGRFSLLAQYLDDALFEESDPDVMDWDDVI